MKHVLLATAALFVCDAAYAGGQEHKPAPAPASMPVAAPANTAISGAAALSASQSRASAVATGGQSRSSATGGRSESNVTVNNAAGGRGYGGGYSARGNTPDVFAPPINGGSNCTVGISLGGAGQAAAGAFGLTWESQECTRRQWAAMSGDRKIVKEAACLNDAMRRAYFSAGDQCARDAKGWER